MHRFRFLAVTAAVAMLASCGGDGGGSTDDSSPASTPAGSDTSEPITSESSAPSTTEASVGQVDVLSTEWKYSYGTFQVNALLVNHVNHPVTNVRLNVELVDAAGTVVAHNDPTAAVVFLPVAVDDVVPASVAIFSSQFPGSESSTSDVRVTVEGWERPVVAYVPVELTGLRTAVGSMGTNFSNGQTVGLAFGEMHNPGSEPLTIGIIDTVVLGADGLPSLTPSLIQAMFLPNLDPGATQTFRLQNVPQGVGPESLRVRIWATVAISTTTPDVKVTVEQRTTMFRRSDGVVNIVGALRNDSAKPVGIDGGLMCVVRDAAGTVVDLSSGHQEASNTVSGLSIFASIPVGAVVGFVCSDAEVLNAASDQERDGLRVEVFVRAFPSVGAVEPDEVPFTSVVTPGSRVVAIDFTFTNSSSSTVSILATVLIRDAAGTPVGAGIGWFCRPDATGCTTPVQPGETITFRATIDTPIGLNAATVTIERHAYAL